MPRPQRKRRICKEPGYNLFIPQGCEKRDAIILSIDEYEVIRWIDYRKKTHEQCGKIMNISRTTVTEIYESARFKISDSIVNGRKLKITGGNYFLCEGKAEKFCQMKCKKSVLPIIIEKGERSMRVAVTYENGEIFQHFGHTEQFKLYDIEEGEIIAEHVIDTNGSGHGALAGLLAAEKVDVLICGGIGGGAQTALAEGGITLFGGATGKADEAVKAWINDSLVYNPNVQCSHHHHEDGHSCGENKHGCGGN